MIDDRAERLLSLKAAAERVADANAPLGRRARERLVAETGLSPQGVDFALRNCLEHAVSRSTLSGLRRGRQLSARSHVLLSANVFVAAFRAIVLGLAQSPQCFVRPSRRSPELCELLHEGSGAAFELVDELSPQPGDPFWAYGSDETLAALRRDLPAGVRFHGHGFGMGAAVFRQPHGQLAAPLAEAVDALARDTLAFDQRGCLSPRVVIVEGTREFAETICELLVEALESWEKRVPRGQLSVDETADALRHEATMTYLGSCVAAGMGLVFLDPVLDRVVVPPVGRYLHVCMTQDALAVLQRFGPRLTTVGVYHPESLPGLIEERIGPRRVVDLGQMQTPPLDGPVDLRSGWTPEVL